MYSTTKTHRVWHFGPKLCMSPTSNEEEEEEWKMLYFRYFLFPFPGQKKSQFVNISSQMTPPNQKNHELDLRKIRMLGNKIKKILEQLMKWRKHQIIPRQTSPDLTRPRQTSPDLARPRQTSPNLARSSGGPQEVFFNLRGTQEVLRRSSGGLRGFSRGPRGC